MIGLDNSLAVLDVGHGNSAVLCDQGVVVVIDTGPGSSLLEYLSERSITHINTVLLSHADQDHIGGLVGVLSSGTVTIDRVHVNTDSEKSSAVWEDLTMLLERAGSIKFQPALTTNDSGSFDTPRVHVKIAAPTPYLAVKGPGSVDNKGRKIGTNTISAVIRMVFNGIPIAVFPGDIDQTGLSNIIENGTPIDGRIVVFPHHGGRAGTSNMTKFAADFVNATDPEIAVFSIGRGKHNTPRADVISTLRKVKAKVRIACTQLSEHCANATSTGVNRHLVAVYSEGKSKNTCCSGTVVYLLDTDQLMPDETAHTTFINLNAPTRLCK